MTGNRTMGRAGRSKTGGDSSTGPGRQGSRRGRVKALGVSLAGLACLAAGAALLLGRSATPAWPPAEWAMVVCDVGQGDAILLADGPHTAIAVDTGPDPAAEDRCLKQFQITSIPLLVLTHFHADHIGGLSAALADARVGEIETTTVDIPPAGAAEVSREAAAAGVPVRRVARRDFEWVSWQVLWPDPAFPLSADGNAPEDLMPGMSGTGGMSNMGGKNGMNGMTGMSGVTTSRSRGGSSSGGSGSGSGGEGSGPNNSSIVMAVTVHGSALGTGPGAEARAGAGSRSGPGLRILLTGDIEQPVQMDLLSVDRAMLRADVLKVPHHGSANQDPDFIRAVSPDVSIISVGVGNPYGHPVARTVRLMGSTGARLYRTDQDGAVVVGRPDPGGSGFAVNANHGQGEPPGGGGSSTDPSSADPGTQPRRTEHRYQKNHSRHYSQ
jgi:competence protein ComEC